MNEELKRITRTPQLKNEYPALLNYLGFLLYVAGAGSKQSVTASIKVLTYLYENIKELQQKRFSVPLLCASHINFGVVNKFNLITFSFCTSLLNIECIRCAASPIAVPCLDISRPDFPFPKLRGRQQSIDAIQTNVD